MPGVQYDCYWTEPNPGPELPRVTCYKAVGNSYRCRQDQGPHGLTPRYATYRVTYDGVNVTYWTKSPNAQTG